MFPFCFTMSTRLTPSCSDDFKEMFEQLHYQSLYPHAHTFCTITQEPVGLCFHSILTLRSHSQHFSWCWTCESKLIQRSVEERQYSVLMWRPQVLRPVLASALGRRRYPSPRCQKCWRITLRSISHDAAMTAGQAIAPVVRAWLIIIWVGRMASRDSHVRNKDAVDWNTHTYTELVNILKVTFLIWKL